MQSIGRYHPIHTKLHVEPPQPLTMLQSNVFIKSNSDIFY